MMKEFKELLKSKAKEGKFVDEKQAKNKMSILDEIDEMMEGKMSEDLKGMKKVTVASPSEEGLEKGLEKAQEIVEQSDEKKMAKDEMIEDVMEENSEKEMDEISEPMPSEEDVEEEMEMSPEEIQAEIARLQSMLEK